MIDIQQSKGYCLQLCNIKMEQCSRQCIRRTLYAVIVGVSPIVICLLLIAFARLVLYRLEIFYNRRQKLIDRRPSLTRYKSGRLALSYTPVSKAELQRIIQGDHQSQQREDSPSSINNNISNIASNNTRKAPKFIKSILTRREQPSSSIASNILANLVIRRDAIDANPLTSMLAPLSTSSQPTFTYINENQRRPSLITITRESVETMTLASNKIPSTTNANGSSDSEQKITDPLSGATTTMTTTTTTVIVEEFLDFPSDDSVTSFVVPNDCISEQDVVEDLERKEIDG